MHVTSQKGAPVCWGSNEALSCAPSPSMQPAANPCMPYRRAGPARARALTERLRALTLFQHNTCAQRDKSWPPTWHRCYGDVTSMHKVYYGLNVLCRWSWPKQFNSDFVFIIRNPSIWWAGGRRTSGNTIMPAWLRLCARSSRRGWPYVALPGSVECHAQPWKVITNQQFWFKLCWSSMSAQFP